MRVIDKACSFDEFEKDLRSVLSPEDTRVNLRAYENFVVFRNAEFKPTDEVLEFGACFGFGGIHVAGHVKNIIISDNYDWIKNHCSFNQSHKTKWNSAVSAYKLPNVIIEEVDMENTDFIDKFFDKIIGYGSFEHIIDGGRALAEMCRVLKDDGRVSMTLDFTRGEAWEYDNSKRGRVYNETTLTEIVAASPLKFMFNPFDEINTFGGSSDINSVLAVAVVLVKK